MSATASAPPGIMENPEPDAPECRNCIAPTDMSYLGCYGAGDPVEYSHGWQCCQCNRRTFLSTRDYSALRSEPVPA